MEEMNEVEELIKLVKELEFEQRVKVKFIILGMLLAEQGVKNHMM